MPSKMLECDFCGGMARKSDLATHIKSKHVTELAKHLVKDAKECSISVISAYLKGSDMSRIPIPSVIHPDTDYWFFTRPAVMEEKDSVTPFLDIEANREAHASFIRELMDIVTLNDYVSIQRNMIVRSKEMLDMTARIKDMERTLREVTTEHDREMTKLRMELDAYRKTVEEVNDGVLNCDLRVEIETARQAQRTAERHATKALEEVETIRWKYAQLEKQCEERCTSSSYKNIEIEEAYSQAIAKLRGDLNKTNALLEREKTKNAKIKDRKRKADRDSQKKKDLLEKLRREEEELRAKKKALKRELNSDDSDDSDDPSDSE